LSGPPDRLGDGRGKSDRLDAYHAAGAVLAGRVRPVKGAAIGGLRALHLTRRSAVKARTAVLNQIHAILVMAPEPLRAKYRPLSGDRLVMALIRSRGFYAEPVIAETLGGLKELAERHCWLTAQIGRLTTRIDALVSAANPALRAAHGVGPDVAAQLLITAGHNPERLGTGTPITPCNTL
jgi:transposase